jgi:hypothetical protein
MDQTHRSVGLHVGRDTNSDGHGKGYEHESCIGDDQRKGNQQITGTVFEVTAVQPSDSPVIISRRVDTSTSLTCIQSSLPITDHLPQ